MDGRVAVVSPHLDDAVLSVGAAIARWARDGADVDVVTVFAGDPESKRPASKWDGRAGFASEGVAVRARREEDRHACAFVGARPVWLPFRDSAYEANHDASAVRSALAEAVRSAGVVLHAGPPFGHSDHAWLATLLPDNGGDGRIGVYRPQPYAAWAAAGRPLRTPDGPTKLGRLHWETVPAGVRERRAKWRAARAYRSQLPLLGLAGRLHLPLLRLLWSEARSGGEAVAWLQDRSTTLSSR